MNRLHNESNAISKLQANFEGKEAIYIEKGALLVRVSDIRSSGLRPTVAAQIDELPAPAFRIGGFDGARWMGTRPLRWTIRAGYLTEFSDHCWTMGYGGWSLYFDPGLFKAFWNSHPDSRRTWTLSNATTGLSAFCNEIRPSCRQIGRSSFRLCPGKIVAFLNHES